MAGKSYYDILGIKRDSTDKDIKQAYRKLARMHHPDVNPGNKSAEARFKEINQAYEVLSDPEKRKKYDQYGDNWQHADQFAGAGAQQQQAWDFGPRGTRVEYQDFSDLGEAGGFGNMFDSILRDMGGRSARRPRQGQDAEYPVEVSLDEAFRGTTRLLEMQSEEPCPACKGKGCRNCGGAGAVLRPRRLEVKIPAGVKDGSRVRIAGKGGPGAMGGQAGDLYLLVSVKADSRFQRIDDDLHVEIPVQFVDAILGAEVEVPTIEGKKLALKIPPETQNGRVFRLAGKGMPHLGNTARGDLYAKVKVVLPTKLSKKEKEMFEELKSLRGK
jgi:DnaJ-class molecular chaperone